MAKLVSITIRNFRSIKELTLDFDPGKNIICFVGRGDSGKTTILEAIYAVCAQSWNYTFYDTDFFNCNHQVPIEIEGSFIELPEKIRDQKKFGLHTRSYDVRSKEILDDLLLEKPGVNYEMLLTVKLIVNENLEPTWTVINSRDQEDKLISAAERSLLNCFMISDQLDRHFSWNKGNPLSTLLNASEYDNPSEDKNVVMQSLRLAKGKIDDHPFAELATATKLVEKQAALLGLNLLGIKTTLDFKELSTKDGRISLHENLVPFRMKGKGSKRLISIAIQLSLVQSGGLMLIDEIEQGLEPDRIKHVVRTLKDGAGGQVFLTTHSRDAITELGADSLCLILRDNESNKTEGRKLNYNQDGLNKVVRACPEAFFAKKIIVCEGATEIGICRALDKHRKRTGSGQMSFKDCAYVDGHGNTLEERVTLIAEAQVTTALFCDSDTDKVNGLKAKFRAKNVSIFDWEKDLCLEKQVIKDLTWSGVLKLIPFVVLHSYHGDSNAFENAVQKQLPIGTHFTPDYLQEDTFELRDALAKSSLAGKGWFKLVATAEALGDIIFNEIGLMDKDCRLRTTLLSLSAWIDQ